MSYSSFGITVDRKHELKWLFLQEKPPCTPFLRTTQIPKLL